MDGHAEPYSVMSASFDDLGNVAFVVANQCIIMARYDGVVSVQRSPHLGLSLGAYGPRVLAVDTNGSRAWESSDAGATWRSVPAPLLDCSALTRGCSWGIHCDGSICFVGDDYTRTAWDTPG
jgi:hypothetical protein